MKKSKYQQYFHCFIVCILVPYAFWFSYQQNIVTILISAAFGGTALIRGEALIRGRRLCQCGYPKVRRLLEGGAYLRPGAYQRKYGKCTATKTSPNVNVFVNFERRITATRINLKFQRYLYLESRGEEKNSSFLHRR